MRSKLAKMRLDEDGEGQIGSNDGEVLDYSEITSVTLMLLLLLLLVVSEV